MAYELREVTLEDLFNSRKTKEKSLKSLRALAEEEIISPVKNQDGKDYYDEIVSRVRVNAARLCKRPQVFWKEIRRAMKNIESLDQNIINDLTSGKSEKDVIKDVAAKIRTNVRSYRKKHGKQILVFSS
jgi:hypothetical protein